MNYPKLPDPPAYDPRVEHEDQLEAMDTLKAHVLLEKAVAGDTDLQRIVFLDLASTKHGIHRLLLVFESLVYGARKGALAPELNNMINEMVRTGGDE